ncbi:hypothetical protein NQ317_019926 [Molorchus minor]|uniref:Nucleolar protein 11 n=1 Tax=Molorchus minor TaxID=1323400 RepID=A0ABQ9K518_9CUCU|nr:hypothetical protein NQ317_019926 [Molorchus minor]
MFCGLNLFLSFLPCSLAQLGSFYGLCPLIDIKSLLGISEDPDKAVAVVTLGKNMACRYKLSTQKLLTSWRTKEKFSSPVVYDKENSKYLAVFNHSYIKLWDVDEESLDKLKKYKFSTQIHTVIADMENIFILFQNGYVCGLSEALETRKNLYMENVLPDTEEIHDILYKRQKEYFHIGIITKSSEEINFYWVKPLSPNCKHHKIKLVRSEHELKGYVFHIEGNSLCLLTLWSDGKIFSYPLETDENLGQEELFAAVSSISTKYWVSMLSIGENCVVMYGANPNEEGATLVVYNTQYKVIQASQGFKLFTNGAKMWCIENNLILPVGQNLAVIPFYLESEQLAALVGSHETTQLTIDADAAILEEFKVVSWNVKLKPKNVQNRYISKYLDQGLPESKIMELVLPDILKQNDLDSLSAYIKNFSDISEKHITIILKYLLTSENIFDKTDQDSPELLPLSLQPNKETDLINHTLCRSFNKLLLLPHLRSHLTYDEVFLLIRYICFLLSDESCELSPSINTKMEENVIEWSHILLESNYQKFLLSKNEFVSKMLDQLMKLVEEMLHSLKDLEDVSLFLTRYENRKFNYVNNTLRYSIEQINWF